MKPGGLGGANTLTGLHFENKVDFQNLLGEIPGYRIARIPDKAGMGVFFEGKIGRQMLQETRFL